MSQSWKAANVVCVTFNSASTIAPMMRSLAAQSESVACLVIADNGSADDTVEIVKAIRADLPFPVVILRNANIGFAGGMRAAGQHAIVNGSIPTLCINPDLELAKDVLPTMLECINLGERVGVVTAPLVGLDGQPDSASIRKLPSLGLASVYAVLGKLTPARLRYNAVSRTPDRPAGRVEFGSVGGRKIEATTGALMLANPDFRRAADGIFDTDYWMYGEDLQLCRDAQAHNWSVVIVDATPSLHVKGVSSGWPRSVTSNWAFHDAMHVYYDKNLSGGLIQNRLVHGGIAVRQRLIQLVGRLGRLRQKRWQTEGRM